MSGVDARPNGRGSDFGSGDGLAYAAASSNTPKSDVLLTRCNVASPCARSYRSLPSSIRIRASLPFPARSTHGFGRTRATSQQVRASARAQGAYAWSMADDLKTVLKRLRSVELKLDMLI